MIDTTLSSIKDRLDQIEKQMVDYSVGLANVYNEFQKYSLSKIDEKINDLLTKVKDYELQKDVKELDLEVCPFPMNIKVKMRIKTNFGQCIYSFDYPPALEYQLAHVIQGTYVSMLNKLYDAHDARGGKYMGDAGCKAWMEENGETIVDFGADRMKRE